MAAHEGDYIADAAVILARAAELSSAGDILEEVQQAMKPLMKRVKEKEAGRFFKRLHKQCPSCTEVSEGNPRAGKRLFLRCGQRLLTSSSKRLGLRSR